MIHLEPISIDIKLRCTYQWLADHPDLSQTQSSAGDDPSRYIVQDFGFIWMKRDI